MAGTELKDHSRKLTMKEDEPGRASHPGSRSKVEQLAVGNNGQEVEQ